jgi:hypothetical protein
MFAPKRLTIFISSPGDVIRERIRLEQTVERLKVEFGAHFDLETIRWEERPLSATEHFQTQIPKPSTTDIVVVILWWRLGTPLKVREGWDHSWRGPISDREVTGTEWEFEDAIQGYGKTKEKPFILVFQKVATPTSLTDEQMRSYGKEKDRVIDFFDRWFQDKNTNTYIRAWREFHDEIEFVDMIDKQLTILLRDHIDRESRDLPVKWAGSPFRGLEAYGINDAPIFFGRTRARQQLLSLAEERAAAGRPQVLVIGASGSGKSSLVRAGLIPDIRIPGLVDGVGLCRYVIIRPSDLDGDPVRALAKGLLDDNGLPELSDLQYDTDQLINQFAAGSDQAAFTIKQGLAAAGAALSEHYRPLLTVVVDQLEELFRLPEDKQMAFVEALERIATANNVWVVATMRSDFLQELERQHIAAFFDAGGRFLLSPPTETELGQIITRPARIAGLNWEIDDATRTPLDEVLLAAVRRDPTSLPLLGYVLDQLWQRRRNSGQLTFSAYNDLGGLEGAIAARAEEVFQALAPEAQAALPRVLRRLVTVGQGDEARPVAKSTHIDRFPERTPDRMVADAMLAPEARLLTVGESGIVRIAHEAVLSHWDRANDQLTKDRQDLQLEARLRSQVNEWQRADPKQRLSRLLRPGLPLSEAEDLMTRRGDELDSEVISFIESSVVAYRDEQSAELVAAKKRAEQAQWRQLMAQKLERRAVAEEFFSRAAQNRLHAETVESEDWRTDREAYASLLHRRAEELKKEAAKSLSDAYKLHIEVRDHPGAPTTEDQEPIKGKVFSLEVLASPHGACSLIHYGEKRSPRLAIVDGGTRATYRRVLGPALREHRERRGSEKLPIELVLVSQYDEDSVGGIAEMLRHCVGSGREEFKIQRLWYNNFQSILPVGALSNAGRKLSFKEELRHLAAELEIPVNAPFDYFVMPSDIGPAQVTLPGGLEVTVIAPPVNQVRLWYEKWLREQQERGVLGPGPNSQLKEAITEFASSPELKLVRRPPVAYAAECSLEPDTSYVNQSSVVIHLSYEGKDMLLCSDSRSDYIMEGLFDAWMLDPDRGMQVDVMMLPHYGSNRNITPSFFEQVKADHYVVIPVERFKLPRKDTLDMLVDARGVGKHLVHFAGGGMGQEFESDLRKLIADYDGRLKATFPEKDSASVMIDLLEPVPPVTPNKSMHAER